VQGDRKREKIQKLCRSELLYSQKINQLNFLTLKNFEDFIFFFAFEYLFNIIKSSDSSLGSSLSSLSPSCHLVNFLAAEAFWSGFIYGP